MDDIEYEDQLEEINLKEPVEVQSYKYSCDMDMKDIPKPLPSSVFRMGIIGRSGSGKSNLVQSLTQATGKKKIYNRQFSNVFIISPSIRSQANRPKLPSNRFYTSLKDLPEIINRLQTEDDLEGRTLLILDDLGSEIKREGKDMVYLKQIFNNGRHIGRPIINEETGEVEEPGAISVMITAQKLTQLAPYIRAQLTHLCLFDCRNTKTEFLVFHIILYLWILKKVKYIMALNQDLILKIRCIYKSNFLEKKNYNLFNCNRSLTNLLFF